MINGEGHNKPSPQGTRPYKFNPHNMIYYENGIPKKNIHMHRLSLKEIVARHKRYQHSMRLLKALSK